MAPPAPWQYLRSVEVDWETVPNRRQYPFDLAAVARMGRLTFDAPVTYLIGENGSGKSTLLEAMAVALGFNAEGGTRNFTFASRRSHSTLHAHLLLKKGAAPRDGFFLRAESFFNLATSIEAMDVDERPIDAPKVIASYGGRSLHEQSHGESFFALFMNRMGGNGLYLLDEPEAALSPTRQMSLLVRMHDLVQARSQFVIATHSPIVLAYPGAAIYEIDDGGLQRVEYESCGPFQIMRGFVNRPQAMIEELLGDDGEA